MKTAILNKQRKIELDKNLKNIIKSTVRAVVRYEGFHKAGEVSVSIVDNKAIRQLNLEYRNIDKETDVLSFPMYEKKDLDDLKEKNFGKDETIILGDVIISIEQAKEQAKEFGHSITRECAYLITHGTLHLFGYNHIQKKDKDIMRKREEEILAFIGVER